MILTSKKSRQQVVAIVPMAGLAKRLGKPGISKEVYPVKSEVVTGVDKQAGVVCEHVLQAMQHAGIERVFITLREGKWDIPARLGDGEHLGLHLAYLMMGLPHGTPYSIDQAYPFIQQSNVVLGFPDTLFAEDDIFTRLLMHHESVDADVVLGLFPADRPEKTDMVDLADDGKVREIVVKPVHTELTYCWCVASWTPVFSHFMHQYLVEHQKSAINLPELYVGDIMQAAIDSGLSVHAVPVSQRPFLDIGTPEDLLRLEDFLRSRR